MGVFALKGKVVGELLSVSIRFYCNILEGMNSDKRLKGESSLFCKSSACCSRGRCAWDGDVEGCGK